MINAQPLSNVIEGLTPPSIRKGRTPKYNFSILEREDQSMSAGKYSPKKRASALSASIQWAKRHKSKAKFTAYELNRSLIIQRTA